MKSPSLKVDIFVFSGDALSQEEMRRKVAVTLRNTAIWFAGPEDIVLQELDWYCKGQGVSARHSLVRLAFDVARGGKREGA